MIKKKELIKDLLILFFLSLNISMYIVTNNPVYLFAVNMILTIIITISAKFSIMSLKIIVLNWTLIPAMFQYSTNESYGLLAMNLIPLYFAEMNIICLIYNLIILIFCKKTNFLNLEKVKILNYKTKLRLRREIVVLLCIIAILSSIVAFPRMPFTSAVDGRFNALFKGNAWNHITVVALLFLLPAIKQSRSIQVTYTFCIFWFLSHYERVDMIGIIIAMVIVLFIWEDYSNKKIKVNILKNLKYILLIGIIIIVFIIVGDKRNGGDFDVATLMRRVLVQKTASDIAYNLTATIDFVINNGIIYGQTLIIYLFKLIPFTPNTMSTSALIQEIYNTAGGDFLLDDAFINFGFIGVLSFSIIECSIFMLLVKFKSKYSFYVYILLLATVFRVEWYGYYYIEKALFYFIPIIMFLTKFKILNRKIYNI